MFVLRGGGGSPNLWLVGVPPMFLVFLLVACLCGVTSLISFWGFRVELSPGTPFFWVAL